MFFLIQLIYLRRKMTFLLIGYRVSEIFGFYQSQHDSDYHLFYRYSLGQLVQITFDLWKSHFVVTHLEKLGKPDDILG